MVELSQSSSSFRESPANGNDKDSGWNEFQFPTGSYLSSMQQSKESFDTTSKEATFSEGTRSTQFDEGSSVNSDEFSCVGDPSNKKEPTTIIVLKHQIAHVEETEETREPSTHKQNETKRKEKAGCSKESRSFTRLRKRFSRKKKVNPPGCATASPLVKDTESKASLQTKGFLPLPRRGSRHSLKEEQSGSMSQLDVVSSSDDEKDESLDGGSLNTYDSSLMNAHEGMNPNESRVTDSTKLNKKSKAVEQGEYGTDCEPVAEAERYVSSYPSDEPNDHISVGKASGDDKSLKSTKSVQSIKSSRSSMSVRSLSSVFKRKRSERHGGHSAKSVASAPGSDNYDRKVKKRRSWIPRRRKRTPKEGVSSTVTSRPRKGILRNRDGGVTKGKSRNENAAREPSSWELLLDGCDGYCFGPIFGEDVDEIESDESRTPSEIYINSESSKTLYTV